MNKYQAGDIVWWLSYCEDFDETHLLWPDCLRIRSSEVKRTWQNGKLALQNSMVFFEGMVFSTREECMLALIKHVETLDANLPLEDKYD